MAGKPRHEPRPAFPQHETPTPDGSIPGHPVHRDAWRTLDGHYEDPTFIEAVARGEVDPNLPEIPPPTVPPTSLR